MEYYGRREGIKGKKKEWSAPPRRGQIKLGIIKSLVKSASEFIAVGSSKKKKKKGAVSGGGSSSQTSLAAFTPIHTPSGYDSGIDSDPDSALTTKL
ncbi:unnamed protein product [Cuscuta campestris]|uniref:Uncharacterized protein n=1 Tax=Cuscuta campestris TaxID=132261 RepID=A0A484NC72_9ASTE|nr:unnamed protein product [Cuscuta campestris]